MSAGARHLGEVQGSRFKVQGRERLTQLLAPFRRRFRRAFGRAENPCAWCLAESSPDRSPIRPNETGYVCRFHLQILMSAVHVVELETELRQLAKTKRLHKGILRHQMLLALPSPTELVKEVA